MKNNIVTAAEENIVVFPADKTVEALSILENEIRANIELGIADSEGKTMILSALLKSIQSVSLRKNSAELTSSVDELLKVIGDLDRATNDLLEGAKEQINEFSELFTTQKIFDEISFEKIELELARRDREREKASTIQEALENKRESLSEEINVRSRLIESGVCEKPQSIRNEKRKLEQELASVSKTINRIIEVISENDRNTTLLVNYREAIKLIKKGLPDGIIGQKFSIDD
jgi:hypothetical protein